MKVACHSCFILLLVSLSIPISYAANDRHALVIGNGNYKSSPLKNPVNDAQDIAKTLRELDFIVIELIDADIRAMDEAVIDFGRKLETTGGVGLFYFAGHGIQYLGKNFLIPLGSKIQKETDLKYEAFDASKVFDEMGYANNGLNIVILDACRDNPLTRSFRSAKRGLAKPDDTPSGLLLAYSTSPGKQASDGTGKNSPYTTHLISAMKKEGIPLELVFKDVTRKVKAETRGAQVPWISSSVDGDFYFSQAKQSSGDTSSDNLLAEKTEQRHLLEKDSVSANNLVKFELLYWEGVTNNPTKEKYLAYLNKYPDGHFKEIAESELSQYDDARTIAKPGVVLMETNTKTEVKATQLTKTLKVCEQHLKAYRLSSGSSGNAYDCYRKILKAEPDNIEAVSGLTEVENAYIYLIKKAVKNNKKEKATKYIGRLEFINSANQSLPDMKMLVNESFSTKSVSSKQVNSIYAKTVSIEQQQIFDEYADVVEEILGDGSLSSNQLAKVKKYMGKLKKINATDPRYLILEQELLTLSSGEKKSKVLSDKQQQIFDEFLEIVDEMLDEKSLNAKQQKKLEKYILKLEKIDPGSPHIFRLKQEYKKIIKS